VAQAVAESEGGRYIQPDRLRIALGDEAGQCDVLIGLSIRVPGRGIEIALGVLQAVAADGKPFDAAVGPAEEDQNRAAPT
jgi:hypothetical protein